MSTKFKEFKSLFIPSDIMPIGMIIIGIIISFFISEIAIKLIGISISILGIVVLLMKLTTRMSSSVETKFKSNPPPNFKITVKKSPEAVRQVIENYSGEIEDKEDKIDTEKNETNQSSIDKVRKVSKNTMGEEEGFRIVKKDNRYSEEEKIDPLNQVEINIPEQNKSDENTKPKSTLNYNSPSKFRKREINIPTQGLLEEMPILKEHPDKEFEFFINRILMAIRSVSNTRTAAYFFYNEYKNEIILNSFATETKSILIKKSKFIAGNDIVSQIARSMKPEILTDINPAAEIDLLPYYKSNSGTNSFIGIPVIYDKKVIGVLTADSKHSDAYDAIMVNFLSHFAKLISGLIRSYSDKYDLAQDSKYLRIFNEIENLDLDESDEIYSFLVKKIDSIFDSRNSYAITYGSNKSEYVINSVAKTENADFEEGFKFTNNNSLLSESLSINEGIYISSPDSDQIRVNVGENLSSGYFYTLPLSTKIDTFGALVIEGKEGAHLDKNEKLFLKSLINKSSNLIQQVKMIELIKNGFDKDPENGLLNENSFRYEIEKEIERVSNFNYSSSLISISFDKYKSLDIKDENINDVILNHINKTLDNTLDSLDIRGRVDDNIILVTPGKNAQSSKLWAERIRNKIANESLYLSDKRYNITVSVGICELHNKQSCDEILKNVNEALNVSKDKTNTVSVYS